MLRYLSVKCDKLTTLNTTQKHIVCPEVINRYGIHLDERVETAQFNYCTARGIFIQLSDSVCVCLLRKLCLLLGRPRRKSLLSLSVLKKTPVGRGFTCVMLTFGWVVFVKWVSPSVHIYLLVLCGEFSLQSELKFGNCFIISGFERVAKKGGKKWLKKIQNSKSLHNCLFFDGNVKLIYLLNLIWWAHNF